MNKTPTIDEGTNVKKSKSLDPKILALVLSVSTLAGCGKGGEVVNNIASGNTDVEKILSSTESDSHPRTREQDADYYSIDTKNPGGIGESSSKNGVPTTREQRAKFFCYPRDECR